ncbi:methylenetetrahydrofolate reductase [Clostridia bacterium]|nr:methylenetetrahydrofolate reductase [Clostridia bacterium]
MRISDVLQGKSTLSFEIFPPKTALEKDAVLRVSDELMGLNPDYISVTYGAGGGGSQNTVDVAAHIQRRATALAHLTCVTADRAKIAGVLSELKAVGVENVLALRGDLPADGARGTDYEHASNLVADIKRLSGGAFCVGGACYPDGHPECESRERDIENIRFKVDAGCDFLVTQLFFDNDVLYNFLYRLASRRVEVPVVAGIMPITGAKQIKKMTTMCGAALKPKHKAIIERWADNPAALYQAGIAFAAEQIADLAANGVRGIHLYTMNRPKIARDIIGNLNELFK